MKALTEGLVVSKEMEILEKVLMKGPSEREESSNLKLIEKYYCTRKILPSKEIYITIISRSTLPQMILHFISFPITYLIK